LRLPVTRPFYQLDNGQIRRTFMPPLMVYDIDFSTRSLSPNLDLLQWGDMVLGGSPRADGREPYFDGVGLVLTAFQRPWSQVAPHQSPPGVSSAVYLVFPPQPITSNQVLPRASRLRLDVEFDQPTATPEPSPPPSMLARRVEVSDGENDLPNAPPLENAPPPWAVALRVKAGNEIDRPGEALIDVTCQFHNTGVRLNDPDKAQDAPNNQSLDLEGPLDYPDGTQFSLGFEYSGIQAGPAPATPHKKGDDLGYAVGCGFLEMKSDYPYLDASDRRLFSSTKLSASPQSWIGALGVAVGTIRYPGTMAARIKRFTVTTFAPVSPLHLPSTTRPNATSV
jgi:hypothetical protein